MCGPAFPLLLPRRGPEKGRKRESEKARKGEREKERKRERERIVESWHARAQGETE